MKNIKDELQHIILGDEQAGRASQLKKVQTFLRRHAETSSATQNQKRFKSEETAELINFARHEKLFYEQTISEKKLYQFRGRTARLSFGRDVRYKNKRQYILRILARLFQ